MKKLFLRIIDSIPVIAFLTAVWCIWSESFSSKTILEGLTLSFLSLLAANRIFLHSSYQKRYRISVYILIKYIFVLIVEIYRSGCHAVYITVMDRINVGVVDLPTKIRDPLTGVMIANAITLTPGTVTIDFSPGNFKVVWIDCRTSDPEEAGAAIKGKFENVLIREEKWE